ncbi:MAG: RNA polymerase sigma factor SigZ [Bacteroidetes bacterium]|jgi:RNA polymerase sigma-70 factor (ECF subfamily)|nr:RNA polymerase sigma factor SigZ [Bacteroidota bacterium]MDF1868257.1 RNA polymerase sigma factor SigZ [Saprospiraceae bacterium]
MEAIKWQNINQSLQKFVQSKVQDEVISKDILQDVYVKVQLKLPQLKDEAKLMPWVFQIARNEINDHFRRQRKTRTLDIVDGENAKDESEMPNTHQGFSQCVPSFLDALPEKYREALFLVEIEGLPQKELAERLNISYSGAKSRVQRGREKLKEALLECCKIKTDVYGNILEYQKRVSLDDC